MTDFLSASDSRRYAFGGCACGDTHRRIVQIDGSAMHGRKPPVGYGGPSDVPEADANAEPLAGRPQQQRQDDDRGEVQARALARRRSRSPRRRDRRPGPEGADATGAGRTPLLLRRCWKRLARRSQQRPAGRQAGHGDADAARDQCAAARHRRGPQHPVGLARPAAPLPQFAALARQRVADSLVAVGTSEALRAIQSDDQLANRFTPFSLPPWRHDARYLRLLNTLEAMLAARAMGLEERHWRRSS